MKRPKDPFGSSHDRPDEIGALVRFGHSSRPVLIGAGHSTGGIIAPVDLEGVRVAGFFEDIGAWFKQAFEDIAQWFVDAVEWIKQAWEKIKAAWQDIRMWLIDSPLMHIVAGICALIPGVGPAISLVVEAAYAALKVASEVAAAVVATVDAAVTAVDGMANTILENFDFSAGIRASVESVDENGPVYLDAGMRQQLDVDLSNIEKMEEGIHDPAKRRDAMRRVKEIAEQAWSAQATSSNLNDAANGALRLTQTAIQQRLLETAPHAINYSVDELIADPAISPDVPAMSILLAYLTDKAGDLGSEGIHMPAQVIVDRLKAIGAWFNGKGDLPPDMVAVLQRHGLDPGNRPPPLALDVPFARVLQDRFIAADNETRLEMYSLYPEMRESFATVWTPPRSGSASVDFRGALLRKYENADAHTRLEMFAQYPDLRNDMSRIQGEEANEWASIIANTGNLDAVYPAPTDWIPSGGSKVAFLSRQLQAFYPLYRDSGPDVRAAYERQWAGKFDIAKAAQVIEAGELARKQAEAMARSMAQSRAAAAKATPPPAFPSQLRGFHSAEPRQRAGVLVDNSTGAAMPGTWQYAGPGRQYVVTATGAVDSGGWEQ